MVSPVSPVSGTSIASPTRIETSTSMVSEPDNAWVAMRQLLITGNQVSRKTDAEERASSEGRSRSSPDAGSPSGKESDSVVAEDADGATLSGESDRIGTRNFGDETPFGERVAIV